MRLTATLVAAGLLACPALRATTCAFPLPCHSVRENRILFSGTVLSSVVSEPWQPVRVRVDEVFAGLAQGTREVRVGGEHWSLVKGERYLFDVSSVGGGVYRPNICGLTGETESSFVRPYLEFLRRRARGETETSFTVRVASSDGPAGGAEVTVTGPGGPFSARTGKEGSVEFRGISPGIYHASARKAMYEPDPEDSGSRRPVRLFPGACAAAFIQLRPANTVEGVVRHSDGSPVPGLNIDLVREAKRKVESSESWVWATTRDDGSFRFEGVPAGWYHLGINIPSAGRAPLPRTYHPGRTDPGGAIPVEVRGGVNGGIVFVLPDFGQRRSIQLCVRYEDGRPAPGALIRPAVPPAGAALPELRADGTGCAVTVGYSGVQYEVRATALFEEASVLWYSDAMTIATGEGPAKQTLILRRRTP